ncbi:MAG: hypothetical protein IKZ27_05685 [Kiritimatiellae bacterium]|nr:hypothetical protein [Kiritimatiellia bacterium]
MRNETEQSPWQMSAACAACQWWNGWICRQNGIGYRDCPVYGAHFVERVVAIDRLSGAAKYVVLEKGQTATEVMRASAKVPLENSEDGVGPSFQGLNLMTYFLEGEER